MGKYPISIVNQLSDGPLLALEDVNISFFLSFFLRWSNFLLYILHLVWWPFAKSFWNQFSQTHFGLSISLWVHEIDKLWGCNLFRDDNFIKSNWYRVTHNTFGFQYPLLQSTTCYHIGNSMNYTFIIIWNVPNITSSTCIKVSELRCNDKALQLSTLQHVISNALFLCLDNHFPFQKGDQSTTKEEAQSYD